MPTQKSTKKAKKSGKDQPTSSEDYIEKLEQMHDRVVKDFYGL